jgi:DNA invertase Pin-like site-specific DNA recombinase
MATRFNGTGFDPRHTPELHDTSPASTPRAAVYLRVSTGRQAEHDLSIPDQRAQTHAWVKQRGWYLAAEYVEPGASATDDKRPEFQRMIERACDGENAFDVIVVHSFSRFFRDAFGLEFYVRKLAKHGVRLVSITQELGDDPAQVMMRQVIALFDEYQSKENAKHVLRSMKENARQGYWNGARPPFGYQAVEVERRGSRIKKKLAIDPVEAETVRLIFRLFLSGHEESGPMGVKAIAVWLNTHGYRTRGGATWGLGPVHALLANPVYAGRMRFNHFEARSRRRKTPSEHVFAEVPAIIEPAVFEQVQTLLKDRNPRVTAPRVVTGPILLTGLAMCATCRGAMTLRTGHLEDRQGASLLHLLQLCAPGLHGVQGTLDPHGQARRSRHHPSGRPPSPAAAPHSAARIGRRSPSRESGHAQRAPAAAGEGGLRGRRTAAPTLYAGGGGIGCRR